MKNTFKSQESNKYLQESWQESNNDKKKIVIHVDEKSYKANIINPNFSVLSELQKSYNTLKQQQVASPSSSTASPKPSPKPNTPAWA
ncbi:hypothetical protein CYY_008742 [Polysphondylium violaceum]|uniref:Uncharacterized protein n=1 Tax=Polysphondylium violaceum TaxID=133409 RepID=A0A8J4PML4_9MYCE|nr:hypothetical protein CYY_008742 [Polysphondylium violaceum]